MALRSWALLLVLASIWGASFLFIKVALEDTSPLDLATIRVVSGALTIGLVFAVRPPRVSSWRGVAPKIVVLALLGLVLPFVLIPWAQTRIDSGVAAMLNGTVPLFTALVAMLAFDDDRMTPMRAAGLGVGFAGIALLAAPDAGDFNDAILPEMAVVLAAILYALGATYLRSQLLGEDGLTIAGLQLFAAAAMMVPVALAAQPDVTLGAKAWLSVLTLGACGTGVALIIYYRLIEVAGTVRASLVTYVMPVIALLLGATVLEESFTAAALAGAALIIGGVALTSGQLSLPLVRRSQPEIASVAAGSD